MIPGKSWHRETRGAILQIVPKIVARYWLAPYSSRLPHITQPTVAEKQSQILQLIADHLKGGGIEIMRAALGRNISRRSLQRHLAILASSGRIVVAGDARARTYRISVSLDAVAVAPPLLTAQSPNSPYVPTLPYVLTSPEDGKIKAWVRLSIQLSQASDHAGNSVRFGIGALEFQAWESRYAQ